MYYSPKTLLNRAALVGAACACFAFVAPQATHAEQQPQIGNVCADQKSASAFVPIDNWIYTAVDRLQALGSMDTAYLGIRPWTRASVVRMLEESRASFKDETQKSDPLQAERQRLYKALLDELNHGVQADCVQKAETSRLESAYSLTRGLSGDPLRDSYHLGSTIVNDYGRMYANGLNNYTGASGWLSHGRWMLYLRGESSATPSWNGYSTPLAKSLASVDSVLFQDPITNQPYYQPDLPYGSYGAAAKGHLLEGYVSVNTLGHVVAFGKIDQWLGPGQGGAMAYSNNADNIYALHINRTEPLDVPLLSRLVGPFRYEFFVGGLRGHNYIPATNNSWVIPGAPWMHVEKISMKPTRNLELGFERTVIWGGKGHEGINLHSFLRSFFSLTNTSGAVKNSNTDPGARFAAWDFNYRLPLLRDWVRIYADGEVHDDVSPTDAPRRAAWRPGIYVSHLPGAPKLDLRVEAVTTDPPVSRSFSGQFMYWEYLQKQGYTNEGVLMGDWIGREDKGGQAWMTYHLSPQEWVRLNVRTQKSAKDFVPGGTTLVDAGVEVVKRVHRDFELRGSFTDEHWKAPAYAIGTTQSPTANHLETVTQFQLTWTPKSRELF